MRKGIVRTVMAFALLGGLLGILGGSSAQALVSCAPGPPGYCVVVGEGSGGAGAGAYLPNGGTEVFVKYYKQTGFTLRNGDNYTVALTYCNSSDAKYHLFYFRNGNLKDRALPLAC